MFTDAENKAFVEGSRDRGNNIPTSYNPHMNEDSSLRYHWFRGWYSKDAELEDVDRLDSVQKEQDIAFLHRSMELLYKTVFTSKESANLRAEAIRAIDGILERLGEESYSKVLEK